MLKITTKLLAQRIPKLKNIVSKQYSGSNEKKTAFANIKTRKPIEIFNLIRLFNEDKHKDKVNLSVGAYRTDEGKPYILPVVRKCEQEIINDPKLNHEYLPILGNPVFSKLATKLVLGSDSAPLCEKRVLALQTISGTGGIRMAADFMHHHMKCNDCLICDPTWENHVHIFKTAGFKNVKRYKYWNPKEYTIDMGGMLNSLCNAKEGTVVIFHTVAHNPTGMDPTKDDWKQICEVMKSRKLFPFFDTAYQGFASGDINEDAWPVRYFVKHGFEMMIAQSFSKNMGLYGERVGNLVIVFHDKKHIPACASQFTVLARTAYSNPPSHGCRIVAKVLGSKENKEEWFCTLKEMTSRIKDMRKALKEKLKEHGAPGKWDHIVKQTGMFSFTGLKPEHVEKIIADKHIYMLKSGRINVCGLTTKNVDYVAKSIAEVLNDAK